jgi:ribonuclease J
MGAELPGNESDNPDATFEIAGLTKGEPQCDGVFITHMHGDHIGLCEKVLKGIPIYCGEVAKEIYVCLNERLQGFGGNPELAESFITFKAGRAIPINNGDMKVTPIWTDHSAYDAYMFVVEGDGKKVLHTGDFRDHGQRGKSIDKGLPVFAGKVDVLITEGTMFGRKDEEVMTEFQLKDQAIKIFKDNSFSFVMCSATNIDRIAAFYQAAKAANRLFICDKFQKDVLNIVTKDVLAKEHRVGIYDFSDALVNDINNKEQKDRMWKAGAVFLVRAATWSQGKYSMKNLFEKKKGWLVYSDWEGYIVGEHIDPKKAEIVNECSPRVVKLHTSGHATVSAIEKVVGITKPNLIITIHSEYPERMSDLDVGGAKVYGAKDGETIAVSS